MIRVVKFILHQKKTLRAFVDFESTPTDLVIRDCTWRVHAGGREWIGLPARPYEDDGGETHWQPIVEFADGTGASRRRSQQQAIAAIHESEAAREQA